MAPCRLLDTRLTPPPLAANTTHTFGVVDRCGVPAEAAALAVNVTVTGQTDSGNLRLYPTGLPKPVASTINFAVGYPRANNAILPLGSGGRLSVKTDMPPGSTGTVNLVLDVTGYFK